MRSTGGISRPAASTILTLSLLTMGEDCSAGGKRARDPAAAPAAEPPAPTPSLFQSSIRPILAARCAPCHEPGGKMYGRLPFDRPSVVASHADGVRRRLKGEDRKALEVWLATLPAPPSDE